MLDRSLQERIGAILRESFADIEQEPLPERLSKLIEALHREEKHGRKATSTSAPLRQLAQRQTLGRSAGVAWVYDRGFSPGAPRGMRLRQAETEEGI
jgi:hypothetical protein